MIMKIVVLYLLFLSCTLIDLGCEALQFFCKYLNAYARDCSELMNRTKCWLSESYAHSTEDKKRRAAKAKTESVEPKPVVKPDNRDIVGATKTIFMTELPVLRITEEEAVEPYKSEQLGTVPGDPDFEDEAQTDSFDVANGKVSESEIDYFEPVAEEEDFEDNSSGVSFEELSESVEVLSKDDPTEQEKEKTAAVLDAISGTELFQFITINNTVYENAKMLMNSFKKQAADAPEIFDINKFL